MSRALLLLSSFVFAISSLALLAVVSCEGATVSLGNDGVADSGSSSAIVDGGASGSDANDDAGNGDGDVVVTLPPAACDAPNGTPLAVQSESDAKTGILGLWLLCGEPSVFGTTDEVGIEIVETGAWFKLYLQNGRLVTGDGMFAEGTWMVAGVTPGATSFGLDFTVYGSGVTTSSASLSMSPQLLVLTQPGGVTTYAFYQSF